MRVRFTYLLDAFDNTNRLEGMSKKYVVALDAGTTSNRAIVFDHEGRIVSAAQREFAQYYPQPGWVEHDPELIWQVQLDVARQALQQCGCSPREVAALGITSQRETAIIWERDSGRPIMNAIVWQDRRTADMCAQLKARGLSDYVSRATGLPIDAYFSATKIAWMLEHVPGARAKAKNGDLCFGTVDSWLVWKLTGGTAHITDYSNASRTMLYNISSLEWDELLLSELDIPSEIMPTVRMSCDLCATTEAGLFDGVELPIGGIIGDQQAALFGQACFEHGMAKNTYGTGSFVLTHTGARPITSKSGLLTTIAWGIGGAVDYALEGSIFVTGAAVQWLRDELGIIESAAQSEELARSVADTGGVYVVPAFAGLGAPYWDMYARGCIIGLTRGTTRAHIARATLESLAYRTRDVLECMSSDMGTDTSELRVDGGASVNDFLMQFQADILGIPVLRPKTVETTARGSAYLAGLASGFWKDQAEIVERTTIDRRFEPTMAQSARSTLYDGWQRAVKRAEGWAS